MAAKKRFNIPTLDELDENKTPHAKNKTKFQLFRRTGDSSKPVNEVTSEKNNSSEQVIGSIKTNTETGKRIEGGQQSHSLKLDLKTQNLEKESNSSSSSKEYVSSKLASNFPSSSSTCGAASSSETTVGDACVRSGRPENVVGKSFKDTFAFLKSTRHYEEAEAKMKEIESAKPVTTKIPAPSKSKPNAIQVNPRQKGNPVLKFIRCVPWEYSDITADYVMGATTCALFLSLRYHHFNPNYIHERLRLLGKSYELRILLVLVDVKDPHQTLRELAKMAIMADLTLMLTWSSEEAGKYLETYKVYENKPVDALQGQNDGDYLSKLQDCLTTVKGINKTDVLTLNSTFGSLSGIAKAPKDDLVFLPGFGPLKAKRLYSIFHEPFLAKKKKSEEETSPVTKN